MIARARAYVNDGCVLVCVRKGVVCGRAREASSRCVCACACVQVARLKVGARGLKFVHCSGFSRRDEILRCCVADFDADHPLCGSVHVCTNQNAILVYFDQAYAIPAR